MTSNHKQRCIGNTWFECVEPGIWVSIDRQLAAVHALEGANLLIDQRMRTRYWELYLTSTAVDGAPAPAIANLAEVGWWGADHVATARTLTELGGMIAPARRAAEKHAAARTSRGAPKQERGNCRACGKRSVVRAGEAADGRPQYACQNGGCSEHGNRYTIGHQGEPWDSAPAPTKTRAKSRSGHAT